MLTQLIFASTQSGEPANSDAVRFWTDNPPWVLKLSVRANKGEGKSNSEVAVRINKERFGKPVNHVMVHPEPSKTPIYNLTTHRPSTCVWAHRPGHHAAGTDSAPPNHPLQELNLQPNQTSTLILDRCA